MTKWGKFTSQVLDLTGSIDSLENLPKEAADYIPMIESDESWRALDGLYLHCGKNNTLDFNYLYSLNSIRFLNGYNGEEVSADLEIGSATVDNFFKSAFLNIYWELDYLYYGFEAINRRSYSLSRLSGLNPSFRYYRINISSSLEDIVVNKTWTVTDSSSPSVLLVLLTTSNSI